MSKLEVFGTISETKEGNLCFENFHIIGDAGKSAARILLELVIERLQHELQLLKDYEKSKSNNRRAGTYCVFKGERK